MESKLYKIFIFSAILIIIILELSLLGGAFLSKNILLLVLASTIVAALGVAYAYSIFYYLRKALILPLDSLVNKIKDYNPADTASLKEEPIAYLEQVISALRKELDGLRAKASSIEKIPQSIAKAVTTNDLLKAVAEGLRSLSYIDAALVLLVGNQKLTVVMYPLFPKEIALKKEFVLEEKGLSLNQIKIASSLYQEELVNASNLNKLELLFKEKGYHSSLCIPLVDSGVFYGILGLAFQEKKGLSKEETTVIEDVVSLMGLKLANIQLFYDLDQKRQEAADLKHSGKEKIEQQIAELKATYSQIIQQGKMASMGLLSAGIAHELNNPIGGILGYTQLILSKLKAPQVSQEDIGKLIKYLELMERDSKRCQWIVSNLLNFARKPLDERMSVDLKEVINNTVGMMEYQLAKSNVKVKLDFPPEGLKKINGNANELQQVFTNLIQNAQDAMPEGGEITISGANKTDAKYGSLAEYIEVKVSDHGCGIAQENLSRIFDPFFTGKVGKSGTGLGLSISYTIVSSHGGLIKVESQEGGGTTFYVVLPVIKDAAH